MTLVRDKKIIIYTKKSYNLFTLNSIIFKQAMLARVIAIKRQG